MLRQLVRRGRETACGAALAACILVVPHGLAVPAAFASDQNFRTFVERFWATARDKGISRATYERAFQGLHAPDRKVLERAAHQPEFVRPIWDYLASAVSESRIEAGARYLAEYSSLLDAIEAKYGVDRHVVIAIWGMESNYGQFLGQHNLVHALATLAHTGSRQRFGRQQLLAALEILQRGDTTPDRMSSSWAGAMGHTQFIPTTYNAYAVDFTGNGRRDIWNSIPDALASTANYLRVSNWRFGETWGYEAAVPSGFDYRLVGLDTVKTLAEWRSLGVARVHGQAFPRPGDRASLLLPAGAGGPAFLVLNNFRSILRYNNAHAYALAVGHLSDRIRGFPEFAADWPTDALPLARAQRKELQSLLNARGFAVGAVDGIVGARTEQAVRAYQRANGMEPDGMPSTRLLEHIRRDS